MVKIGNAMRRDPVSGWSAAGASPAEAEAPEGMPNGTPEPA
jgi:hypothetical protein